MGIVNNLNLYAASYRTTVNLHCPAFYKSAVSQSHVHVHAQRMTRRLKLFVALRTGSELTKWSTEIARRLLLELDAPMLQLVVDVLFGHWVCGFAWLC